jgi:hypothetical protein
VVVGGLVSSLALSLFLLPMLYRLFAPPVRVGAVTATPLLDEPLGSPPARAESVA